MRYAFINYDAYPYITSGLIIENHPERVNTYRLEGFGEFWLEPKLVLHGEQGKRAHEDLRRMRDDYRRTLSSITAVYMEHLRTAATTHTLTPLVQQRLKEFDTNRAFEAAQEAYRAATASGT